MRRVNVVGTSGSGKSVFGRRLAARLGCPYVEMDVLFWRPGWTMTDDAEFFEKVRAATSGPAWVLDGNYQRTEAIKWAQVDVVVWLDYSFARTVGRVVRRAVGRAWTGDELWEHTGNRETFRRSFFSKESIIRWAMTTHAKNRRAYARAIVDERWRHVRFVRLRTPAAAEQFLANP